MANKMFDWRKMDLKFYAKKNRSKKSSWQNSWKAWQLKYTYQVLWRLDEWFSHYRGDKLNSVPLRLLSDPWPKVTEMGGKYFFPHPSVNHMWFEEFSRRGFPVKLKRRRRRRRRRRLRRRRKRTKNNILVTRGDLMIQWACDNNNT